ncbi:hypothetical protein Xcc3_06640 [Xanthomonas campestris pv. campestris]|nr:hypothetical protein Xcc1_06690 [Xanthomonas campestris pv. campestris]BBJ99356.1 hypothetical protein Xcc3_06640 [Xanthomonas campestris pv. campestris]
MLGIGMYPRTLRFLRAVRTHLTAARYVLLAALSPVAIAAVPTWPAWSRWHAHLLAAVPKVCQASGQPALP